MTLWSLVLAIHLLAMTAWVGGMATLALVVQPALATIAAPDRLAAQRPAFKRLFLVTWHAMPLSLITGWAMVFGLYGGFAGLPWPVNVMQAIGLVMAALFLFTFFGPWRRFRADASDAGAKAIHRMTHVNLGLGAIVVVVASFAHWAPG